VLHGNGDETVPFEGSGQLTHRAVPQSELVVLDGAPHGCNVSHARDFNQALISSWAGRSPGREHSGAPPAGLTRRRRTARV